MARVETSALRTDSRFIVTNLTGSPKTLYEKVYCARGRVENRFKPYKLHLASDRTSCTRATANQFRLLAHTAANWLMHTLRGFAPKTSIWRDAQFDTIRLTLIKVAGRVTEMVTRTKLSLPSASSTATASSCWPPAPSSSRHDRRASVAPNEPSRQLPNTDCSCPRAQNTLHRKHS